MSRCWYQLSEEEGDDDDDGIGIYPPGQLIRRMYNTSMGLWGFEKLLLLLLFCMFCFLGFSTKPVAGAATRFSVVNLGWDLTLVRLLSRDSRVRFEQI